MHSALVQELVDVRRRDTEVSVPAFRRHRIRRRAMAEEREAPSGSDDPQPIATAWVDPGDTMARGSAVAVTLREAIVRRNHVAARAPAAPVPTGCADIDWARAMDRTLVVKRIGRGVLRIRGGAACATRVSIGVDGLAFTLSIAPGAVAAAAIAARLSSHYHIEMVEESSDSTLLVLVSPRSHT